MVSAGFGMERLTGAADWAKPHRGHRVLPVKEAYWRVPAAAGVESDIVDFAKWMQAMMGARPDVLPGGGQATPMVYEIEGRQVVLIYPGGHHFMETPISDTVIAYALPEN